MNVAIIGGGITGLATAYYLQQQAGGRLHTTLIESSPRLGGKITTTSENGFLIEGGPDSFITQKTAALTLCHQLGLKDHLIGCNTEHKSTYVFSNSHLHPMPEGMMLMAPTMMLPFLRSRLISWPGKMRMGMEALIPASAEPGDESLASFVTRRLGTEALDKLAAPLIAGIFAADPEKLSLRSTFPIFLDMEQKHGSILRSMLARKKAATRPPQLPMFVTLRGGLHTLIDALTQTLDPQRVWLNRRILTVTRNQQRYRIELDNGEHLDADEVVFATPADQTASLIEAMAPNLAASLRSIRYVSTATISLGFKRSEINHDLNGFGFVVPHSERRSITACSWSSTKFTHRAPDDAVLIRAFVGGDRAQPTAEQDEATLIAMVREELRDIMGITADPICTRVYRWSKANPQYDVGHLDRVAEIERLTSLHPGLHLAGAAYRGAGIPACIESALQTVNDITQAYRQSHREAV
jgi:oxygen-dependent protoporphyrinogen oxidase